MSCLSGKLALLQYAAAQCSEGKSDLKSLFYNINHPTLENAAVCIESGYIQFENFTRYVVTKMAQKGKYVY